MKKNHINSIELCIKNCTLKFTFKFITLELLFIILYKYSFSAYFVSEGVVFLFFFLP